MDPKRSNKSQPFRGFENASLAEAKPMLLRDLATSDVADFLRELKAGKDAAGNPKAATPRTKNNARGTVGAFFKFCKQRG